MRFPSKLVTSVLFVVSCTQPDITDLPDLPGGAQAISLLGDTLYSVEAPPEVQQAREAQLEEARLAYDADPGSADAIVWLGRRTAYLGRYREAVRIFTEGISKHPDDARMYRHRGHRFITLRMFDRAASDFERAAELTAGQADEVEPDGQPNVRNTPTSTLQSNIWYHLGLARYLLGDFDGALKAYRECLLRSNNPDMLVATSHWLYMALRRMGRVAEAAAVLGPITANMDIIENDAYPNLLLMYKGEIALDSLLGPEEDPVQNATVAYGLGNYHYYNGRVDEARRMFRSILAGSGWAAFGYIAAEAELARMGDSGS
jgi:tetratricopeptide (TPR) repeat protein